MKFGIRMAERRDYSKHKLKEPSGEHFSLPAYKMPGSIKKIRLP